MKFLVKFHSTFANIEISVGKFGIYFDCFFFPVKMKKTRETRFWPFWRFFSRAHFVFQACNFSIWLFSRPLFFSRALFFIFFTDWKFSFMGEDLVFFMAFLHFNGYFFFSPPWIWFSRMEFCKNFHWHIFPFTCTFWGLGIHIYFHGSKGRRRFDRQRASQLFRCGLNLKFLNEIKVAMKDKSVKFNYVFSKLVPQKSEEKFFSG